MKQKYINIYLLVQAIYFHPLKYYSYVLFQLATREGGVGSDSTSHVVGLLGFLFSLYFYLILLVSV